MHLTSREIYTALTSSVKHFPHTLFLSLDLVFEHRLNTTNILHCQTTNMLSFLRKTTNYFQTISVKFCKLSTLENNCLLR